MFTTTLQETGNTFSLNVPVELVRVLHMEPGIPLDVVSEGDRLIISPRKRYSLAQLLKEHAEILPQLGDNREWVDAPAVGGELI